MLYALLALAGLFFLSKSGVSFGVSSNTPINLRAPQAIPINPVPNNNTQVAALTQQSIGIAAQGATTALKNAGSSLAGAVPIIGAAVGAVVSFLQAASEQRRKQATNENTAVANAVPGWDQAVAIAANGYSSGQFSLSQAFQIIDAAWSNFWNEVTPQIQPGRNGCQGGAVTQPSGTSFCGGKTYGAACCVGYDDLKNSANNLKNALQATDSTGKPAIANILPVFASKYGGANRAGYTLTVQRPTSVFAL